MGLYKLILTTIVFLLTTYLVNAQDTLGINLRKLAEMKLACERLGIDPYSFKKAIHKLEEIRHITTMQH